MVYASPTRIAWQISPTTPASIAVLHGQNWVVRQLRPPRQKGPQEGITTGLERGGTDHLVLVREDSGSSATAAWTVSWDGDLTPLRWPKYTESFLQVVPWIDGKHLVVDRVTDRRIAFVDGETGKVVRSFREAIPPP